MTWIADSVLISGKPVFSLFLTDHEAVYGSPFPAFPEISKLDMKSI
jgi:hypothetical protein